MTAHPGASPSFMNRLKQHWPDTLFGRWTIAMFGVHVVLMTAAVVFLSIVGGSESEAFFDPPAPAVGLIIAAVAALAATVLGLISIFTHRDRSVPVIVATVLAAAPTLFFIGELLSMVGVLPGH